MGKAKQLLKKAAPSKPLKISTSLFKRRLSKNSSGQVVSGRDNIKSGKKLAPTKGGKESSKSKPEPSTSRRASSSPTPKLGKNTKKTATTTTTTTSPKKKGKSNSSSVTKSSETSLKNKKDVPPPKGKQAASTKGVQKRKQSPPSKPPPPKSGGRGRRSSSSSADENNSSSSENSSSSRSTTSSTTATGRGGRNIKKSTTTTTKQTPTKATTTTKNKRSINNKSDADKSKPSPSSSSEEDDDDTEENSDEDEASSPHGSDDDASSSPATTNSSSSDGSDDDDDDTDSAPASKKKKTKPTPAKKKVVPTKNSKSSPTKGNKPSSSKTSSNNKKVINKKGGAASLIASKKKKLIPSKSGNKSSTEKSSGKAKPSSSTKSKPKEKPGKGKAPKNKDKDTKKEKASSTPSKKTKVKPRAKFKRMASLNAKAILEASFSFENQDKKQRSSSIPPPGVSSPPLKVKEETKSSSVSVSTSPPPPPIAFMPKSSPPPPPGKVGKRKSSEILSSSSRRESTASNRSSKEQNNHHQTPSSSSSSKPSSRRNSSTTTSTSTSTSADGPKTKKKDTKAVAVTTSASSPGPNKKKSKVSVSTTSTSTGTSPPPSSAEFYPPLPLSADDRQRKQKVKKSKSSGAGVNSSSSTSTTTMGDGRSKESSGVQANQVKSAGSLAKEKERKSSSSVAHFGNFYQPAGPLIEPHKVPAGLLPETVKLPPDLKVTYQTHPPKNPAVSSQQHSSSSSSSTSASSSAAKADTSSGRKHATNSKDKSSSGQILHQPYKSSSSSSSTSQSRHQSGYPTPNSTGSSYVINPATATGSPLHLSSQPTMSSSSHHHGHGHQIPVPPGPASSSAAPPSAGGLFYSTSAAYAPHHHSPFAPSKYPMVPPESYRTHSPYQNSFLYPSANPAAQAAQAQQQSYFMTPFYTPPLTPNSTPGVMPSGIVGGPPRPLSLTHPSMAAASFYAPPSALQPPQGMHPASSYLVASPHHSLQPPPTAPGHAGRFLPNPSTQPACPCPTEPPCPPSSTSSNRPPPQQQSVFNVLHPATLEAGVKPTSTLSKKPTALSSRHRVVVAKQILPRPSASSPPDTPPPITITLLNNHKNQTRGQLESAKTFTEQYSLPDDITITPIIVNNSSNNSTALLLKNTSISLIHPPTMSSSPPKNNSSPPVHNSAATNPGQGARAVTNAASKKKERDIVHVIDPRSGLKTTIAKHISNRNLLVKNNKAMAMITSPKSSPADTTTRGGGGGGMKKLGVGKLNPDLDVIVINNNNGSGVVECDDSITENLAQYHAAVVAAAATSTNSNRKKSPIMQQPGKKQGGKKRSPFAASSATTVAGGMSILQQNLAQHAAHNLLGGRVVNDPVRLQSPNYSLPPGISISSRGGKSPGNQNNNIGLNLTVNKGRSSQLHFDDPNTVHVQAVQHVATTNNNKKRISLNECIDGLQKKKLKLLEDPLLVPGLNGANPVNGNVISRSSKTNFASNNNGTTRLHSALTPNFNSNAVTNGGPIFGKAKNSLSSTKKPVLVDSSYSSARVRDPQLHRGGTVIKSSDAVAAVSAVVIDPDTYHLKSSRLGNGNGKGLRNGFNKKATSKFQQGKGGKTSTLAYLPPGRRDLNFVVGMSKVKTKGISLEKAAANYLSTRNTRSTAANAKIKTRFSNKPKGSGGGGGGESSSNTMSNNTPRNRSRLLRKGNQICGVVVTGLGSSGGIGRRSESDSSTNTSRSSSAVRIINGNVSTSYNNSLSSSHTSSKVERENRKYPTQAFINAVADLYQYRRNVLLRVPRAGVGVFPSASSINLDKSLSPSSSPSSSSSSSQQQSPLVAAFPNHNLASRSSSPAATTLNSGFSKGPIGSMAANAAKKRAVVKPLSPAAINGALLQMGMARRAPKWSNGWRFEGEPYETKVFLNNDDPPVVRRCYPAMRHESGDVIQTRDCVLLKSGSKKNDLPYIAKIATLWENPIDGEMMFSLLWYYRPEHTEMGRAKEDMTDEIFASKHLDVNSVATIDDRCYVLTFNEYCRYRKRLKQLQEALPSKPLLSLSGSAMHNNNAAGNIAGAVWNGKPTTEQNRPASPGKISPEVVFFCKKVYDFRQKRIMKNPS
ncbi:mucin-19 isoform X2 [Folsomia candida]|uniref:mucin-19 isoform X2 n=1 Tax=Folsomia candida TaxID=158441 RepID=UPI000B8F8232|nr:mucin-19 isoform X2 [Folsomia candida]